MGTTRKTGVTASGTPAPATGIRLSVALATYNEEKNLDACLASVRGLADEIVVVDGSSGDKTADIARAHRAKVTVTDNPPMFHINKQKALDLCRGAWILQLDADEVVSPELAEEIRGVMGSGKSHDGYYLPRKNFFVGRWLSKGGQYPDYVIRLFRNGKGHFPNRSVHEQIAIDGTVGHLVHPLLHYTNRTYEDYWRKADTYTTLTAAGMRKNGVGKGPFTMLAYFVWKPFVTFIKIYVRHKGFVDGWEGFLFACFSGLHHAIAYGKYLRGE